MLPLYFDRPDLFRNVLVNQVCPPYLAVHQEGDAMNCQVKNLPVLASTSNGCVQPFAAENLGYQLTGIRSLIVRYSHVPNVNRAEFVPTILKESLESGIRQLNRALPVQNHDPHGSVFYERAQIGFLIIEINCQALALADLGSYEEADRRQHEHEHCDFGEQDRSGRKRVHRDYDSKI